MAVSGILPARQASRGPITRPPAAPPARAGPRSGEPTCEIRGERERLIAAAHAAVEIPPRRRASARPTSGPARPSSTSLGTTTGGRRARSCASQRTTRAHAGCAPREERDEITSPSPRARYRPRARPRARATARAGAVAELRPPTTRRAASRGTAKRRRSARRRSAAGAARARARARAPRDAGEQGARAAPAAPVTGLERARRRTGQLEARRQHGEHVPPASQRTPGGIEVARGFLEELLDLAAHSRSPLTRRGASRSAARRQAMESRGQPEAEARAEPGGAERARGIVVEAPLVSRQAAGGEVPLAARHVHDGGRPRAAARVRVGRARSR